MSPDLPKKVMPALSQTMALPSKILIFANKSTSELCKWLVDFFFLSIDSLFYVSEHDNLSVPHIELKID